MMMIVDGDGDDDDDCGGGVVGDGCAQGPWWHVAW